MDTNEWLKKAEEGLKSPVLDGRKFEVKDLFLGAEWEKLPIGDRRYFGHVFAEAVREGKLPNVEMVPIGKSRHNRYRKIPGHK